MTAPATVICDESDDAFGWISPEPAWMARASHALASNGAVWLVDPVDFDGLDDRVGALGTPHAVLQLLDRHTRDCAAVAARLGVPHLIAPAAVPGSPFTAIRVPGVLGWRESALWWPDRRTLIVAEAVGTVRYYRAPGRILGVHPTLRVFRPPTVLLQVDPARILCSHGRGVHSAAGEALREAVRHSRRDLPAVIRRIVTATKHPAE